MNVLHLIPDQKFVLHTQTVCEAANPGGNRYRIHTPHHGPPAFPFNRENTDFAFGYFRSAKMVKDDCKWCDAIIIHFMKGPTMRFLSENDFSVPVLWCGWGNDYYSLMPDYRWKMLLPKTRYAMAGSLRRRLSSAYGNSPPMRVIRTMAGNRRASDLVRAALRKVDFFCAMRDPRADPRRVVPEFDPVRLPIFPYYSIEEIAAGSGVAMSGPDILLGNSAWPSSNHLDALESLSHCELGDARIVLPLSYGGPQFYLDHVLATANKRFGDRVVALRRFLPMDEYNEIICRCGTVLMNNLRGQAMGNLIIGLYRGANVHLRRENPYLALYRREGVHLFHMETPQLKAELGTASLNAEQKRQNREIVERLWAFPVVVDRVRSILKRVVNRSRAPMCDASLSL